MSRTKNTRTGPAIEADPRIPFPHSPTPTVCKATPALFAHDLGDSTPEASDRMHQAKTACRACPIAADCLKWALANPTLTREGIWAATTARERTTLRRRLVERLGKDWVGVVADHDRRLHERREAARHSPLPVAEARIVHLDREANGPTPTPRRPLTPGQQQRNPARLLTGVA
ncbi:hypothetical protein GCM10010377_68720 [Streptomyces viridiviolaceus]|uniref:WhiB family transcriptional regulator n=1 Tax=Streptomyces viridiviolaceus TaxID=68282 RepID=A0ABW2ECW7_9ACTN|nr:WhiB family transcriptional regulator [Streptomyces viridiviolaceus]GHB68060.1 hypothetical protein GCM10010377_68720 [Streptomyces viridiviolaceus]